MSYVDDWGQTPTDARVALEQVCEETTCGHARYLHGDVSTQRNGPYKWIEHKPGRCTGCSCQTFRAEPLITEDEVLDLAVALRYEVHLDDLGIAPLSKEKCAQLTIRHTGAGQLTAACLLEKNHPGDHEPDWSDLHSAS